jgi:CubicO group peptidase (beta-lactamase class C family)
MSGEAELAASKVMTDADKASVESYVSFLSRQPLSFLPGSKQEYSGTGAFSVLTGIIQKISGMPYEEFLKKEIFAPCCMQDTTFLPSDAQWARLVMMHDKTESGNAQGKTTPGCVFTSFPAQSFLGGAGLISSLGDYFNFAQMLLNGGVFEGKRVLSEASVAQITTPHFFKKEEESWGLGVRVISEDPRNVLPAGTFGWSGAFGTHFWVDPTNRVVAIYLKNSCYDGGAGALTSRNFEKDVYASLLN